MRKIHLELGKKIYFASDFHLGIPGPSTNFDREKKICDWLELVAQDAQIIFLVGDLFDVWFEYKTVVPKGFIRFFGTLLKLREQGIEIEVFSGNHDFWMNDYFQTELKIPVHTQRFFVEIDEKLFLIGHGDGLGPGDTSYKLLKKVLNNKTCQWLYKGLHPNLGLTLASWFSRRGPKHKEVFKEKYLGKENEFLIHYALKKLETQNIYRFIFGHRHLPISFTFQSGSKYLNLGDWIYYHTYAYFDGVNCELEIFKNSETQIIFDKE